ncbi:hypothetical protein ASC97_31360 [Rhizobium sp. Root1203]|nr:hypothetical protein ASC97_31360 [Rhizobium sp. Root1203]
MTTSSAAPGKSPTFSMSRRLSKVPGKALLVAVSAYILLPMMAVLLYSLATRWTSNVLPDGYTLSHWAESFADERFRTVLLRSLLLAVGVALADILLVAPAVYWQHVRNPMIRPVLETLAAIPFAMPLVVLAFGMLEITGDYLPWAQGTVGLVVVMHMAVAFSFVYWALDGSMSAADVRTLTEASRTCGASLRTTIVKVILPNIGPGLTSGAIMAFGISFNEIALVQILVGSRFETVQLYLLNMLKSADADFNILAVMTSINFFVTLALSIGVVYFNDGASKRLANSGQGGH